MKNEQPRLGLWITLTALLCLLVWFGARQHYQSGVNALREENTKLRADLVASEARIAEVKDRVDRLESAYPDSVSGWPTAGFANVDVDRRFATLAASQSNLVESVEKLVRQMRQTEPLPLTRRQREEARTLLQSRLDEHKRKLGDAQKKIEELMMSLKVPDDIAAFEPDKALDVPGLKVYWPYFEARRQRDNLRAFERILSMKVASELIDSELPRSQ
jgi:hypothetical protein